MMRDDVRFSFRDGLDDCARIGDIHESDEDRKCLSDCKERCWLSVLSIGVQVLFCYWILNV